MYDSYLRKTSLERCVNKVCIYKYGIILCKNTKIQNDWVLKISNFLHIASLLKMRRSLNVFVRAKLLTKKSGSPEQGKNRVRVGFIDFPLQISE